MQTAKVDLTLLPAGGRHLAFAKEVLAVAHVFRRVGGEAGGWEQVATNARSPYVDEDAFAAGTLLEYYVQHQTQQGTPAGSSHVVSTTIPASRENQAPTPDAGEIPLAGQPEQTRATPLVPDVTSEPARTGQGR